MPISAGPRASPIAETSLCPHPLLEDLGLGDGAEFLRCMMCGDVLVVRGASQWTIRRAEGSAVSAVADLAAQDSPLAESECA